MADYYVNDNADERGDHEVHENGCSWLERARSKSYLGHFPSCAAAVREAKKTYPTANGCAHCAPACDTS